MPLSIEEVQAIAAKVNESADLSFQLGAVSALYAATDDPDAQQKLATSLVYLQTRGINDKMAQVSAQSRAIAHELGISNEMLEMAGQQVSEIIEQERQADAGTSNNLNNKEYDNDS